MFVMQRIKYVEWLGEHACARRQLPVVAGDEKHLFRGWDQPVDLRALDDLEQRVGKAG